MLIFYWQEPQNSATGGLSLPVPEVYAKSLVPSLAVGIKFKAVLDPTAIATVREAKQTFWDARPENRDKMEAKNFLLQCVRQEDIDQDDWPLHEMSIEYIELEKQPVTEEERNFAMRAKLENMKEIYSHGVRVYRYNLDINSSSYCFTLTFITILFFGSKILSNIHNYSCSGAEMLLGLQSQCQTSC